ncbi:MAG: septum formation initiator family protein [Gemmatimonadaceae bacterium]|nr:septum formation initiator family protein [Gemmatimonadaceae bacterium]
MSAARKSSARTGKQRIGRIAIAAGLVAVVAFAIQGGEYGTSDLWRQKERRARLIRTNDSLTRVVDSLRRYKRRLETDAALQERIAREEFGLVRGNKELLYRFAEPGTPSDSVPRSP